MRREVTLPSLAGSRGFHAQAEAPPRSMNTSGTRRKQSKQCRSSIPVRHGSFYKFTLFIVVLCSPESASSLSFCFFDSEFELEPELEGTDAGDVLDRRFVFSKCSLTCMSRSFASATSLSK
eukprot:scaffold1687_cov366-Pinguiococcus_pyrenoidosus.AAC.1